MSGPTYHLLPGAPAVRAAAPALDPHQRRVVDHEGGPLLVLAGPGTGKTTTLVEAIVDRVERRGASPESVLALTFSRKAAEQLRDRVTARLGRTMSTTMSSTFHSFAYGLIRAYSPPDLYAAPLRLLSAPEQDVILRELLTDHPESVAWPDSLRRALGTRGFAREVQAVLSRAREKGLDGDGLALLGEDHGLPEFVAAGRFLDQYLTVMDAQGATDYADLIRRATIEARVHQAELRARFSHVFVDEYQDTDPGQVALLRALAGDGRDLTVVGDPHQSIYGFRGAEVRGILEFPTAFPHRDGGPADVVALRTTRRFGPRILTAAQRVAGRIGLPGTIDPAALEAYLHPASATGVPAGRVTALTFDTERSEAEHLADRLRRAHLEDGLAWHEMAILVRSGRASIPGLRRSLGAAGVPVEVASDDTPLVRDPAVAPLLEALRAVLNLENDDPDSVDFLDVARAESLLLGPLGGLDAADVRRLARALRVRDKEQAAREGRSPESSRALVRRAALQPGFLEGLEAPEAVRARRLHDLLTTARGRLLEGASAEEVLWVLWSGTSWPQRLRRSVDTGGGAARRANRDLDSLCALFEAAARVEEQRDHVGVRNFVASLVAQQLPADTLAERGVRGSAVRLLTAHRSKGLEWRLVVAAHVQQDGWPDLRRRASLLQADRIGADGVLPPVSSSALLQEERRLFYVACTRACEQLVVTAVRSSDDEGEQPSRFLAELGVSVDHVAGRPRRPLSLAGLVSELRRTVADETRSPALREAAARRLARLTRETAGQRPLVPQADPASWWGTRAATRSVEPVREADRPVPLSASVLDQIALCPAQWFLEHEAGGVERVHQAANLGRLVHALAERVAGGELTTGPGDVEELMAEVDAVWGRLEFRTPWSAAREHERVRAALGRFLRWHYDNRRRVVGLESQFETVVDLPEGDRARLGGFVDRLEVDVEGRAVVVDLKTGRRKPSGVAVQRHLQLGLYQYAVDHGGFDTVLAAPGIAGGAELVQLGLTDGGDAADVQVQDAQGDDDPARVTLLGDVGAAVRMVRTESFPARPGEHCSSCAFVPICPAKSAGSVVTG